MEFLKFLKNRKFTIIFVIVILIIISYAGARWYESRMFLVNQGLADPKFPYKEYSILELARQGKITEHEEELDEAIKNLPTRITPKEVFDIYTQALEDGDIERALECIEKDIDMNQRIGKYGHAWNVRESDREYLYEIKKKGELKKEIKNLEKIKSIIGWNKIEEAVKNQIRIYYQYPCSFGGTCGVGFTKDLYGDWKLNGSRNWI